MGMIFGYIAALAMGMVSFENVGAAGWFQFTMPMHFGMKFELTSIISMLIMYVVSSVEAIGDSRVRHGRIPEPDDLPGEIIDLTSRFQKRGFRHGR